MGGGGEKGRRRDAGRGREGEIERLGGRGANGGAEYSCSARRVKMLPYSRYFAPFADQPPAAAGTYSPSLRDALTEAMGDKAAEQQDAAVVRPAAGWGGR